MEHQPGTAFAPRDAEHVRLSEADYKAQTLLKAAYHRQNEICRI